MEMSGKEIHMDAADGKECSHSLSIPLKRSSMLSRMAHPDFVSSEFRPSNSSSSSILLAVALLLGRRHPIVSKRKEKCSLPYDFIQQEEQLTSLSGSNKERKRPYVASSPVKSLEENGKEGKKKEDLIREEKTLHLALKSTGSGMNVACEAWESHSSDDQFFLHVALLRKEMSSHKSHMRSSNSSSHETAPSILARNETTPDSSLALRGFATLHDLFSLSKLVDRKTSFSATCVQELTMPILPLTNLISSTDISAAFLFVTLSA